MMMSAISKLSCFNCGGTGSDIFYPYIESLVACDAIEWLYSAKIESFIHECPYCRPLDDLPWLLVWGAR